MTVKRVAVTGGAGFIGSHVARQLLDRGYWVTVIDSFDTHYDPLVKRRNLSGLEDSIALSVVEGDILDRSFLCECFSRDRIDVVIHLAGATNSLRSVEQPHEFMQTNVLGTLSVLEAMSQAGIRRIVFGSSAAVYGNLLKPAAEETLPLEAPLSPYAVSKVAAENLCRIYHNTHEFDATVLRFFNVYGPRQRPDAAIPLMVDALLNGKQISLFGNGSSKRDYVYIDDAVEGVLSAMERMRGFEIFNIGEGRSISLVSLVKALEARTGKQGVVEHLPMPSAEVYRNCADIRKANKLLGYTPQVSLIEGLGRFYRWTLSTPAPIGQHEAS